MIQFPLVIPSHLFTYPFSTINNLTHTIQPHKPQTSLVSFPSSALVSATLVNFHIVHLNLFSIFYTLTARWSQHLQLCYLCVLSLAHLCSKCPLLALIQAVSVPPNVGRGALKLGWRTDAWSFVGYVAVNVSVCHQELMGTNMSALVIGTWRTLRESQNALN